MNLNAIKFYNENYEIYEHSIHLNELCSKNGTIYLGNRNDKTCRFCGKNEKEVSFKKIAHVLPESIGNHNIFSYYECDDCNDYFGKTIENEFANFFSLPRSVMGVKGKRGVPKCKYRIPCDNRTESCMDYCIEYIDSPQIRINLCDKVKDFFEIKDGYFVIRKQVGKCCPIAVYKAFLKMVLTLILDKDIHLFSKAISWILDPNHMNIYKKELLVRYKIILDFNSAEVLGITLYKRKTNNTKIPFMLYNMIFNGFSILLEVPVDNNGFNTEGFKNIPFPECNYKTNKEGLWDFSGVDFPKGMYISMFFNYDSIKESVY